MGYMESLPPSEVQAMRDTLHATEGVAGEIALCRWALTRKIADESARGYLDMEELAKYIAGFTEQIRKLVETQHRMEQSEKLAWTPRQVRAFIMQVANVIDTFVTDQDLRTRIGEEFRSIMGGRGMEMKAIEGTSRTE